jgi:hypothetical protein
MDAAMAVNGCSGVMARELSSRKDGATGHRHADRMGGHTRYNGGTDPHRGVHGSSTVEVRLSDFLAILKLPGPKAQRRLQWKSYHLAIWLRLFPPPPQQTIWLGYAAQPSRASLAIEASRERHRW